MTYNMTQAASTSSSGLVGLLQAVNEITSGYFGIVILLSLSFVFFLGFMFATRDAKKAILGTAPLSFVLCVLLVIMQLANSMMVFITLVAWALALASASNID